MDASPTPSKIPGTKAGNGTLPSRHGTPPSRNGTLPSGMPKLGDRDRKIWNMTTKKPGPLGTKPGHGLPGGIGSRKPGDRVTGKPTSPHKDPKPDGGKGGGRPDGPGM